MKALLTLLLVASAVHSSVGVQDCEFASATKWWDLSDLQLLGNEAEEDYHVRGDDEHDHAHVEYFFNVCGPLVSTHDGCEGLEHALAIERNTKTGECAVLGSSKQVSWQLFDTAHPEEGLVMIADGGDSCTISEDERHFHIRFVCDEEAGVGAPKNVSDADGCHFELEWRTELACSRGRPGMSTSGFLVLVLLVGFVVYCAAGIAVNSSQGKSGMETIPNSDMWLSCMTAVADLISTIFGSPGTENKPSFAAAPANARRSGYGMVSGNDDDEQSGLLGGDGAASGSAPGNFSVGDEDDDEA